MKNNLFLRDIDLQPALSNKEDSLRYFNFIIADELREFIAECYNKKGMAIESAILDYENKVAEIAIDMMIRKGLLSKDAHQGFVDVLLTSIFLHNLYFEEKNLVASLFKARENLEPVAIKMGLHEQVIEAIFEGIEAQLGDATPIKKLKPSPNTPQSLLADSIFVARSLNKWI